MLVVDILVLLLLLVGEVQFSLQAEELPLVVVDGLLHLLLLLQQHTHLLLQQRHHQSRLLRHRFLLGLTVLPLLLILNDYMLQSHPVFLQNSQILSRLCLPCQFHLLILQSTLQTSHLLPQLLVLPLQRLHRRLLLSHRRLLDLQFLLKTIGEILQLRQGCVEGGDARVFLDGGEMECDGLFFPLAEDVGQLAHEFRLVEAALMVNGALCFLLNGDALADLLLLQLHDHALELLDLAVLEL